MKHFVTFLFVIYILNGVCCAKGTGSITETESFFHGISGERERVLGIQGKGPNGEDPVSLQDLIGCVKDVRRDRFKGQNIRIVLCMHDLKNDWSNSLVDGIRKTFGFFGLKLDLITDGELSIEKQIQDLSFVIARKPDVILILPLDSEKLVPELRRAIAENIKLVFIDSIPNEFTAPSDFCGWAVGNGYVMGRAGAEILVEHLGGKGKVAMLNWNNKMFTVDQRTLGARKRFKESSGIVIVDEIGFKEFYEIQGAVKSLFKRHPDIQGIWTVWDYPAFEVIKALNEINSSAVVVTADMSLEAAKAMLNRKVLIGTAVDHPFNEGIAVSIITVSSLLHITVPPFCMINAQKVTPGIVKETWKHLYHKEFLYDLQANGK